MLLANEDPEMMRNMINYELGPMSKRILVRSGNPSSIRNLQKVSAGSARHILVLTPHVDADVSMHGSLKGMLTTQIACIKSLQQMSSASNPRGIVVTPRESAPEMLMGFNLITPTSFQQHVLATATLQRGLTGIYQQILDQTRGAQLYLFDAASRGCDHLHDLTMSQLDDYFPRAVVLGWLSPDGEDKDTGARAGKELGHGVRATLKRVNLHPSKEATLPEGAQIVLMSGENSLQCSKDPTVPWIEAPRRGTARTEAPSPQSHSEGSAQDEQRSMPMNGGNRSQKTMLLLNFVDQWGLLQSLDTPLHSGTKVIVLAAGVNPAPPQGRYTQYEFRRSSVSASGKSLAVGVLRVGWGCGVELVSSSPRTA